MALLRPHIDFEYKCNQRFDLPKQRTGNMHCQLCQTDVHDLTSKTNEEILDLLKINGGNLCGQFFKNQLEEQSSIDRPIRLKMALASIVAFLTITSAKISAQSQNTANTEQHNTAIASVEKNGKPVEKEDTCITFEKGGKQPLADPDEKRKKAFLVIGRMHFYISHRFPFIRARRIFMGRIGRKVDKF